MIKEKKFYAFSLLLDGGPLVKMKQKIAMSVYLIGF